MEQIIKYSGENNLKMNKSKTKYLNMVNSNNNENRDSYSNNKKISTLKLWFILMDTIGWASGCRSPIMSKNWYNLT